MLLDFTGHPAPSRQATGADSANGANVLPLANEEDQLHLDLAKSKCMNHVGDKKLLVTSSKGHRYSEQEATRTQRTRFLVNLVSSHGSGMF